MPLIGPYDDDDYGPTRADLTEADAGYVLCSTCGGEGVGMEMKCYGGSPVEVTVYCDDCGGEGQIEVDVSAPAPAEPVRARMRDWKQS